MDSANVDGKAVVENLSAIIDTGTTLIVGDTKSVSEFYDSISGSTDASQTVGDGFFTGNLSIVIFVIIASSDLFVCSSSLQ